VRTVGGRIAGNPAEDVRRRRAVRLTRHRGTRARLDLEQLPPDVRAAVEDALAGDAIVLHRSGVPIGSLEFRSNVLEGTVVEVPLEPAPTTTVPDGVTVVATAMKLSDAARRRLSEEFGDDYVVLDINAAPDTTDVLLTHPVSPQLLGILRHQFPHARVVITEIEDEELGVRYAGPVSRLLDAGASAYLPPRPIAETAANVHAYLTQSAGPVLEPGDRASRGLPPPGHER
jgi:hypothetical protein